MSETTPPTLDPVAARRWDHVAPPTAPWLHEEVARRMAERLSWIVRQPRAWANWHAVRGGLQGHAAVAQRYPAASCHVVETAPALEAAARAALEPRGWRRWLGAPGGAVQFGPPADGAVDLIWSNMALHACAHPQTLIAQWHRALAVDGFLMFSCLGPDTLVELRGLYQRQGWPAPTQAFTDMHDWGDMLVAAGFAEPVMDMERIRLSFDAAPRALEELRGLGRNLHPARFGGLRARAWRDQLLQTMAEQLAEPTEPVDGGGAQRITLTFEIVYGHAFKPQPRPRVADQSSISLTDFRAALRQGRPD